MKSLQESLLDDEDTLMNKSDESAEELKLKLDIQKAVKPYFSHYKIDAINACLNNIKCFKTKSADGYDVNIIGGIFKPNDYKTENKILKYLFKNHFKVLFTTEDYETHVQELDDSEWFGFKPLKDCDTYMCYVQVVDKDLYFKKDQVTLAEFGLRGDANVFAWFEDECEFSIF